MLSHMSGLISIAGIIGVGKTTLANNLALKLAATVVYEQYKENPFLARQYSGCRDSALPSELFFLLSRAQQLAVENFKNDALYITDYIFQKNRFFASMSLDSRQMDIYDEVERSVLPIINKPDIVIYLHDSIENCQNRILSRGRAFERTISLEFLSMLNERYFEMVKTWHCCPVIEINCSEVDTRAPEYLDLLTDNIIVTLKKRATIN